MPLEALFLVKHYSNIIDTKNVIAQKCLKDQGQLSGLGWVWVDCGATVHGNNHPCSVPSYPNTTTDGAAATTLPHLLRQDNR